MSTPTRILIVRLGAMGDIIHAMPAVLLLRSIFPQSQIGWVIESRWSELLRSEPDAQPLSEQQPLVDFVHLVDTRKWRKNFLGGESRRQALAALREVRPMKYDLAIDFQGAIKSAAVAKLSGAKQIYGFADPWEKPATVFYAKKIPTSSVHVVERNFDLAAAAGDAEDGAKLDCNTQPKLPKESVVEAKIREKLQALGLHQGFVLLNPGAGWGAKQWPAERYAKIARVLGQDGLRSLVNFGPGEEWLAKIVEEEARGSAVAAQFSISELIAVTRRASLFIGGDTGPLHLAAALKIPIVALFGPTDPARTGPYGTLSIVLRNPHSITSHKRNRETEAGLMNISAEQVIAVARELLGKAGA